jgi:hypothetical protein
VKEEKAMIAVFKYLNFLANKTYSLVQPTLFLNSFRQISTLKVKRLEAK